MATKIFFGQTPINRAYIGATQHTIFSDVAPSTGYPDVISPDEINSLTYWYDYSSYSGSVWYDKNNYSFDLNVSGTLGDATLVDNGVAISNWGTVAWTGSVTESIFGEDGVNPMYNTTHITWFKPQAGYLPQTTGVGISDAQPIYQLAAKTSPVSSFSPVMGMGKTLSGSINGVVDIFPSGALSIDPPFGEPDSAYVEITSSVWYMATVVIDSVGSQSRYLNTTLYDNTQVIPTKGVVTSSGAFSIAGDETTNGITGFSGSIGTVMMFNEALAGPQVNGIYNFYSESAGYVV